MSGLIEERHLDALLACPQEDDVTVRVRHSSGGVGWGGVGSGIGEKGRAGPCAAVLSAVALWTQATLAAAGQGRQGKVC